MNKYNWLKKNIVGFGLTSLFNDMSHEMTTAILPAFVAQVFGNSLAPQILGLTGGISNFFASFTRLTSGWLSDRIKYHKLILIIGYAITPLFVGLIGTVSVVWQLVLYKTLAWIGRGLREPVRDSMVASEVLPINYGKAFGFIRSLDTLGAIIGPLIALFVLKYISLRNIFFISFIPGILSVLSVSFIVKEQEIKKIPKFDSWFKQFQDLPVNFFIFVFIVFIFGIGNFHKTLIIFRAQEAFAIKNTLAISGISIALYIFLNFIRAISEYLAGLFGDLINRKNILAFFGFGSFAFLNLMLIFAGSNIWLWLTVFLFAGISMGTIRTLLKAYAAEILPEDIRGTGYGVLQATDGLSSLIANIVVGTLWSQISYFVGFLYAIITSLIAMFLLIKKQ